MGCGFGGEGKEEEDEKGGRLSGGGRDAGQRGGRLVVPAGCGGSWGE